MPITSVHKDLDQLTLTVISDYAAPRRRVWDAYADPRQIERFWGPPEWPATFTRHDFTPGGLSSYRMTGPDGEIAAGYWEFLAVDAPNSFEVLDGFAQPDGTPNPELPNMRMVMVFEAVGDRTRVTSTTHFNSLDQLHQLVEMGMEEGLQAAMGQIDAVLADLRSFVAGAGTESQILNDTQVRISRTIDGPIDQVWAAHQRPELLRRWMLGPEGWTMPVCEVATAVGDAFRYEWADAEGANRFGFTGELIELDAPHRSVTTERMIDTDGPSTLNEMTLTTVEGGTLLSLVITYPDSDLRDTVLATGMVDGMEASYARMEKEVLVPA